MANEPIALATNLNNKKITFPFHMSEKVDGIAVRINSEGHVTRQNKQLESIHHIQDIITRYVVDPKWNFVGELFVEYGMPFKKASGIIRRKSPDNRIKFMLYDVFHEDRESNYETRFSYMSGFLSYLHEEGVKGTILPPRHGKIVTSWEEADEHFTFIKQFADLEGYYPEGYVARQLTGPDTFWAEGKRTWGMQRFKDKPTADLRVVNVVEASANKAISFLGEDFNPGDGLRAVGRIEVEFKGEVVGVGPGKLSHKERRYYWENPNELIGKIIEVEYMRDKSYNAMREPTFQRIRNDKTEPDTEL